MIENHKDSESDLKRPIYNSIGKTYDLTRKADPAITAILKKHLFSQNDLPCIDIGCGSGNYTSALFNHGILIEGLDISDSMLSKARSKYPTIAWHQGDAENLPFSNGSYSGATCILATHHFHNKQTAFKEIYRVLSKGYFVIFTSTPEQMKLYWLSHYFPNLIADSCKTMQSFAEIRTHLLDVGFANVIQEPFFVTNDLQDLFLQSGKYRPEIYLDKNVRAGISSFQLANDLLEIENGLTQLENDLYSGRVQQIINQYESNKGDYLFIICKKD